MSKKNKIDVESKEDETILQKNDKDINSRESGDNMENTDIEDDNSDPLVELQKELEVAKDRYIRTFAEFENYKRRTDREKIELYKTAGEDVLKSLLPVLDDFERALKEIEKSGDNELAKGVILIHNKLRETLRSKGLEQMEVKQGDTFSADSHEAITQIPAPDKKLKGKIVDVIENGYTLSDKIIRYPKVIIGQ